MTGPLRTLYVTPDYPPPPGGIQTMLQNVETGVSRLGHAPRVIQVDPSEHDYSVSDARPTRFVIPAVRTGSPHHYLFYNSVYRRTSQAIDEFDPDIVHAFHLREFPALVAAREHGIPCVVTLHALELSSRRISRAALETADAVHAVSRSTAGIAERVYGVKADVVIPPSIDVSTYRPDSRNLSNESPQHTERTVFTISRLVKRKNIDTLLDAWEIAVDRIEGEWTLEIAGDGPLSEDIRRQARRLDAVQILGRVSEETKRLKLQQSDLFVLPASGTGFDIEGFGIVYIEAQAAGTPVVGSVRGGVPEAVGRAGALVRDEQDPSELADVIVSLLTDRMVRERCLNAINGRIHQFDIEPIAQRYLDFYTELLEMRLPSKGESSRQV